MAYPIVMENEAMPPRGKRIASLLRVENFPKWFPLCPGTFSIASVKARARMPRVKSFLMCLPLRSGTLVVASVTISFSTLLLLFLSFTYDAVLCIATKVSWLTFWTSGSYIITRIVASYGVALAVGLVAIAINVLLIIGVQYKKPFLFVPWLGVYGLNLVVMPLMAIGVPFVFPIVLSAMPAFTAGIFFLVLIIFGITVHVFLVVYSYYRQLQEQEGTGIAIRLRELA